jgi:hypothetical protein
MAGPYLDLNDRTAVCDFIESVLPYLPEKDRKTYEALIETGREGSEAVTPERLAEAAKNIGIVTWPQRHALLRFIESVGSELEWEAVVKNVRPSTAVILKRLRKDAGTIDLASTIAHADASIVLKPDQEIEISMVRDEARIDLYEDHKEALEPMIEDADRHIQAVNKRMKTLRDQAVVTSGVQQDTLFEKLNEWEDRIYFGCEMIEIELLDADLAFTGGGALEG